MKKILFLLLILLLGFGGYILYTNHSGIPKLKIEDKVIDIDELYIYGSSFNMHGNQHDTDIQDLVLYNGEFTPVKINFTDDGFNLSNEVNDGVYLDKIPRGKYYLFLRTIGKDKDNNDVYKYYAINNKTDYKTTTYYTFKDYNNKIFIDSDNEFSTLAFNITKNNDEEVYDIVIDPGHGGMDSGSSKYGYDEANFTMNLAVKLKNKLENNGFSVKLTREEGQLTKNDLLDEYGTNGRAVIPYEVHAKYVISLHMNSSEATSVNGIEVYTAKNINYSLAKEIAKSIVDVTGLNYSRNKISKIYEGVYTRTFTNYEIKNSNDKYINKNMKPYNITTDSNYYYMIRETGGIVTGAFVDDRNKKILGNPYVNSNVGVETYLLELGYITNKNDMYNMKNNTDKYAEAIYKAIKGLKK